MRGKAFTQKTAQQAAGRTWMLKYCQLPGATWAPWVERLLLSNSVGTLQPTSPQFASQVHAPQRP